MNVVLYLIRSYFTLSYSTRLDKMQMRGGNKIFHISLVSIFRMADPREAVKRLCIPRRPIGDQSSRRREAFRRIHYWGIQIINQR